MGYVHVLWITLFILFTSPFELFSKEIYIFLGPCGSGKTTQARWLAKELTIPHISCGDLLRAQAEESTELGKICREYLDQGQFVPQEIVLSMMYQRLSQNDCREGYVLDGFPRTLEIMSSYQEWEPVLPTAVFFLDVSETTSMERCLGREGRSDDQIQKIRNRWLLFMDKSLPVVEIYDKLGILFRVNAELSEEEVREVLYTNMRNVETCK